MSVVVALIWIPISAVLWTLTLSVLWRWFLLPLGLPELALAHLFGVALVVSLLTQSNPTRDDDDLLETTAYQAVVTFIRLGSALALGWVALQLWGGA